MGPRVSPKMYASIVYEQSLVNVGTKSFESNNKYRCKEGDVFFLFCVSREKHLPVQDWMRHNFDHKKGLDNLFSI